MVMQFTVQAMHKNEYFMSNEYLIMVDGSTNHKGIIVLKPLSYYYFIILSCTSVTSMNVGAFRSSPFSSAYKKRRI